MIDHALVGYLARQFAERNMRATVRVERMGDPAMNGSNVVDAIPLFTVYDGPARITPLRGPQEYILTDQKQHYSQCNMSVPIRPGQPAAQRPMVDDVVTVLAFPDDDWLVGREYKIDDVESGGQYPVVHRFSTTGVQDSATWNAP